MQLNTEQTQFVRACLNEGLSIGAIQEQLKATHGLHLTYMETRFLIDDLALDLPQETHPESDEKMEVNPGTLEGGELVDDGETGPSSVQVSFDPVVRPGALLNGNVCFSDGEKASWHLDNMGRLAIKSEKYGYRPSAEDLTTFQQEIQKQLSGWR